MVGIPEYFLEKARRQFGDRGTEWVDDLPDIILNCISKWHLTDLEVVADLSINLLYFASSPHGHVVLKIEGPHQERRSEIIALELYNGRFVCRPLEIDRDLGTVLLERIYPGTTLRRTVPEDEQLKVGAELIRDLPIPVDSSVELPRYRDWIDNAVRSMSSKYEPVDSFQRSIDAAAELAAEIRMDCYYLLHGDLHHDNILLDKDGEWRVIDPQGVIGPPLLECGRFIQNHAVGLDNILDLEKARITIDYISGVLGHSPRDVWIVFYILHVLSFCWGYEMNYPTRTLLRGAAECTLILDSIAD